MTEPEGTFEEEIRRALRSAGDLLVPAGDGLQKIRERTIYRPRPLAWLLAYAAHLLSRPFVWLRVVASEVAAAARGQSDLASRLRSAGRSARRWPNLLLAALRSPGAWLRPALAAAAALALVFGVALAVPRLRGAVATLGGFTSTSGRAQGGGSGGTGLGGGSAQSSGASAQPRIASATPGQPYDATMPPVMSSRCRSGTGTSPRASVTPFLPIPPSPGPGATQTIGAGTIASRYANTGHHRRGTLTGGGAQAGSAETVSCSRATQPTTMPPSVPPSTSPPPTPPPSSTPPTSSPPPSSTPPTSSPPPSSTPPTSPPTTASSYGSPSPTGTASPG